MAKQTSRRWVALGSLAALVTACSLDLARLTQGSTGGEAPAGGDTTPSADPRPGALAPGRPTGPVAGEPIPSAEPSSTGPLGGSGGSGAADAGVPPLDGAAPTLDGAAPTLDGAADGASPAAPGEPPLVTDDCISLPAGASALFCLGFHRAPVGQWPLQQVRDGSSVTFESSGGAHDAGALYAFVPEPSVATPLRGKAYFRSPRLRPRTLPSGTARYVAGLQFWIDDAPRAGSSGRATLMSFVSAGQAGMYSQVALQLVVTANGLALEAIQQVAEREPYRAYLLVTDKPDGFRGRWNSVELTVTVGAAGQTRWMNIAGAKIAGSKTKPGPIAQDPNQPLRAGLVADALTPRLDAPPVDAPADGVPLFEDPWLEVGLPYTEASVGSAWAVRANDLFVYVQGS